MRNKFEGRCYHCGLTVRVGEGFFERHYGHWKTIHASCVPDMREKKKQDREKKEVVGK